MMADMVKSETVIELVLDVARNQVILNKPFFETLSKTLNVQAEYNNWIQGKPVHPELEQKVEYCLSEWNNREYGNMATREDLLETLKNNQRRNNCKELIVKLEGIVQKGYVGYDNPKVMTEGEKDFELEMVLRDFNILSLYYVLHDASVDSEILWELKNDQLNQMGMKVGDQIRYQKAKQRYEQSGGMLVRKIIFVGAQRTGKTTILNSLAGSIVSQSKLPTDGITLTKELQHKNIGNITYCDTPGLEIWEEMHNKEAAVAISKLLKDGGICKVVFVVNVWETDCGGWTKPEDNATMRLILEATPEIGSRYGLIVNNCPEKQINMLSNSKSFATNLFFRIDKEYQHDSLLFLKRNPDLKDKKNLLLDGTELEDLNRFLQDKVPWVELTPEKCKDVQADKFEQFAEEYNKECLRALEEENRR